MNNDSQKIMSAVDKTELEQVTRLRVLFAHHSVGGNIIGGLKEIIDESGVTYPIVDIEENKVGSGSIFMHARPGKNTMPKTKTMEFKKLLLNFDGEDPQIAFMKYCYLDFDTKTNVDEVFEDYRGMIESLKKEKPNITFMHVTAPFTKRPSVFVQKIKRIIDRGLIYDDVANLKREEFNQKLKTYFKGDFIFDLAAAESTKPDESREEHEYKGRTFHSLVPEYASDESHLNAAGSRIAAKNLVAVLAAAGKEL